MKYLFFSLSLLCGLISFGQDKVTFFRTKEMAKETSEKKAKFRYTVRTKGEFIVKELYDIANNCVLSLQKFDDDNHAVGVWKYYKEDCSLLSETDFSILKYSSHEPVKGSSSMIQVNETDTLVMPTYGESSEDLMRYLFKNKHMPKQTFTGNVSGIVYLSFVILADGSVSNVFVLRGVDPFVDLEAVRVVKEMPNWNPAFKNGKAVNVQYNLPVQFR